MQNIDRLFFSPNGTLRTEFDELYNALFNQADGYINIVQALAKHREGLTRQQIIQTVKIEGGVLTKMLRNLDDYRMRGKKYAYTFDGDDELVRLNEGIIEITGENVQLRKRVSYLKETIGKLTPETEEEKA